MEQAELKFAPAERKSGYLEPGKLGFTNATTSREAAEKASVNAGAWRERVYKRIAAKGADGSTDDELASFFGVGHNTVAPRRTELASEGRVVSTERRRETRAGGSALVWVVR